jgi:hypothetical protein
VIFLAPAFLQWIHQEPLSSEVLGGKQNLYGPSGMCPDVNQSSYQPSPEIGKLSIGYSENRANRRTITLKVSPLGVDSLWGDCTFIPADWGSL